MPSECLRELVERERGFITMLIVETHFPSSPLFRFTPTRVYSTLLACSQELALIPPFVYKPAQNACALSHYFCLTSSSLPLSLTLSLTDCRLCKHQLVFPISLLLSSLGKVAWERGERRDREGRCCPRGNVCVCMCVRVHACACVCVCAVSQRGSQSGFREWRMYSISCRGRTTTGDNNQKSVSQGCM